MNYFSQSKAPKELKPQSKPIDGVSPREEMTSTIAPSVTITGQIACASALVVHGRIKGDIHASKLVIAAGALVDGEVTAADVVIEGEFKGTLRANTVKLTGSALINGEVHNRSLSIDPNAQFEGVSRRLEKPVEAPSQAAPLAQAGVVDFSVAKEGLLK
jgi:cytoskeletal protein CcmA (bactofilin family)